MPSAVVVSAGEDGVRSCKLNSDGLRAWPALHFGAGVSDVAFGQSTSALAVAYDSGAIEVREFSRGNLVAEFDATTSPAHCVAVAAKSAHTLCSGHTDGLLRLWDASSRKIVREFHAKRPSAAGGGAAEVRCCGFRRGDDYVAFGAGGAVHLSSVLRSPDVTTLPMDSGGDASSGGHVNALEFSPHRKGLLAAVSDLNSLRVWDVVRSDTPVMSVDGGGGGAEPRGAPATAVRFSPLNHLLFCTAGLDKQLSFYDIHSKRVVKRLRVEAPVRSMAFHASGVRVMVGTTGGRLLVYDLRSGDEQCVHSLQLHAGAVRSLAFRPTSGHATDAPSDAAASAATPTPTPVTARRPRTVDAATTPHSVYRNASTPVYTRTTPMLSRPPSAALNTYASPIFSPPRAMPAVGSAVGREIPTRPGAFGALDGEQSFVIPAGHEAAGADSATGGGVDPSILADTSFSLLNIPPVADAGPARHKRSKTASKALRLPLAVADGMRDENAPLERAPTSSNAALDESLIIPPSRQLPLPPTAQKPSLRRPSRPTLTLDAAAASARGDRPATSDTPLRQSARAASAAKRPATPSEHDEAAPTPSAARAPPPRANDEAQATVADAESSARELPAAAVDECAASDIAGGADGDDGAPVAQLRRECGDLSGVHGTSSPQEQLLRRAIADTISPVIDDLRGDVRNLHVELLRGLHEQEREVQAMRAEQQRQLERLRVDTEALRAENRRLRATPGGA